MSGRLIREGLRKARAKGIKLGAPLKLTPDIALKASNLRSDGLSYKDIAKALDISVGSVCAVLGGFK
jgi:DNA invertase Pin-like site-specific DNA recombinase